MRVKSIYIYFLVIIFILLGCDKSPKSKIENSKEQRIAPKILDNKDKIEKEVSLILKEDPNIINSTINISKSAKQIEALCNEGLTAIDEDGKVISGIAESWQADINSWTFKIKRECFWSNGDRVTASDFYFGIKKAIENSQSISKSEYLFYIKGARDYFEKKNSDFKRVGIKIIDEYTIKIELEKFVVYFPSIVGTFQYFHPINQKFYEMKGEEYGKNSESVISCGPYIIEKWLKKNMITLVKNNRYWDAEKCDIDKIKYKIDNNNEKINDENSMIQIIDYNSRLKSIEENYIVEKESGGLVYLEFNLKNKYLSLMEVRKAIALSIKRDKKESLKNLKEAYNIIPTNIMALKNNDNESKILLENKEDGKRIFEKLLKDKKIKGKIKLKILCEKSIDSIEIANNIRENVLENLGIDIKIDVKSYDEKNKVLSSKDFDLAINIWQADIIDPINFLDIWSVGSEYNYSSWKNKEYEELLKMSKLETDYEKRMEIFKEAESKIIKEFPISPLFFTTKKYLLNKKNGDIYINFVEKYYCFKKKTK